MSASLLSQELHALCTSQAPRSCGKACMTRWPLHLCGGVSPQPLGVMAWARDGIVLTPCCPAGTSSTQRGAPPDHEALWGAFCFLVSQQKSLGTTVGPHLPCSWDGVCLRTKPIPTRCSACNRATSLLRHLYLQMTFRRPGARFLMRTPQFGYFFLQILTTPSEHLC